MGHFYLFENDRRTRWATGSKGLRQLRGVLGHRAEDEGGGLLVEPVLLGEGVHKLGQDLVGDNLCLSVFILIFLTFC